jgi:uncharacterized membrane protein YkvA (DUF1232 family)
MNNLDKYVGITGLSKLTFAELKSSDKLVTMLTKKVHQLKPGQFTDELLEARVRMLIDILRETLSDRYQKLSLRAFSHMMVALDYFLDADDDTPDHLPGGYKDDLQRIEKVFAEFKSEIEAFKKWKLRLPKDHAW